MNQLTCSDDVSVWLLIRADFTKALKPIKIKVEMVDPMHLKYDSVGASLVQ